MEEPPHKTGVGGISDAGHARLRFPPKRESQPPRRREKAERETDREKSE